MKRTRLDTEQPKKRFKVFLKLVNPGGNEFTCDFNKYFKTAISLISKKTSCFISYKLWLDGYTIGQTFSSVDDGYVIAKCIIFDQPAVPTVAMQCYQEYIIYNFLLSPYSRKLPNLSLYCKILGDINFIWCRCVVIAALWALLFLMIYKVLTLEKDYIEYDPFEILQLDPVSPLYSSLCSSWNNVQREGKLRAEPVQTSKHIFGFITNHIKGKVVFKRGAAPFCRSLVVTSLI